MVRPESRTVVSNDRSWRAGLWNVAVSAAGVFSALMLFEVLGLNAWVLDRVHRSWHLPGYEWLFTIFLVTSITGINVLLSMRSKRVLLHVALGVLAGYASGILSHWLSPLLWETRTVQDYWQIFSSAGFLGTLAATLYVSIITLSWLYGGASVLFSILYGRLARGLSGRGRERR